jgi:hypothetical protein
LDPEKNEGPFRVTIKMQDLVDNDTFDYYEEKVKKKAT